MGKFKIISWNLNGLLSCVENNDFIPINSLKPDILCLQEIRTNTEPKVIDNYRHYWNASNRNKYSGTAVLVKNKPVKVINGFDGENDNEGRIITVELEKFYVINVYVPNSQQNLERKAFRNEWDRLLREYVEQLMEDKPIIICGDFNVVRDEIDFYKENERQYWKMQGYISDERSNLESLLDLGLIDVFRELNPEKRGYTWWSNRLNKRQEDRGWRLDYFLISEGLMDSVIDMRHLSDIGGSDHCPIMLEVRI